MFIFSLNRYFLSSTCWNTPGGERERERNRKGETERERQKEREMNRKREKDRKTEQKEEREFIKGSFVWLL